MSEEIQAGKTKNKWWRVLQFFAAYLVASWTFLQFVDWFINRYQISPYWVDLGLWLFAGIIPSLLIYFYNQDRINNGILHLREKIIFPLNIIIIAVGLYFGFGTSDLGATTKDVEYTRADGSIIRKTITKAEFRTVIPLFNFKQTSKDSATIWLENGIRDLLFLDIHQDKNVNPIAGFADNTTEKVQMNKAYHDFYVDGTYSVKNGIYNVNPKIRKSNNGKVTAKRSFSGRELAKILDSISVYLRKEVGVTDKQREQYVDLDIQEFTSDSLNAIKHYVLGDYDKAIAIDSSFALAYLRKAQENIIFSQGKYEERYNIEKAFLNRSRLPADRQLQVLIYKLIANEDWEKAEILVDLQLEIEPNNQVYSNLLYLIFSETKQVKAYLKYARSKFEKDENMYNVGRYGEALLINGEYQTYIDYINNYMKMIPDDKDMFIANVVPTILKGDLVEARKILDKASILQPDWDNLNKVYDEALRSLERNSKSEIKLSFFEGEFRNPSSEMEFRIWVNNNVLLSYASNQTVKPLIRSGETKLLKVLHTLGGLSTANYLQDDIGNTYAIQIEQYNRKTSWEYFAFKLDNSIRKAEALLALKDYAKAETFYLKAIKNNPKHFYLKDAVAHINYIKEIDSVALQDQYKEISGTYGPRKFWVEENELFYKRDGYSRMRLLPIAKDRYMNMTNMTNHFAFEYNNGKVINSYVYQYDLEKEQWAKSNLEGNTLNKD